LFQFQNGAIIGDLFVFDNPKAAMFQFQNGAIIGTLGLRLQMLPQSFNSKMVRL